MVGEPWDIGGDEDTETRPFAPLVVLPRELGQVPPAPDLVGVKAHGLAQLLVIKARTPRFGVLTRPAFDLHVAQEPVRSVLRQAKEADLAEKTARAAWSEKLVRHCQAIGLPDELDWGIDELVGAFNADDAFAVRASVVAPLAEVAAMRGCFETFLFVRGEAALRDAVVRVYASAFSVRCLEARFAAGKEPIGARLAVIVQRMVDAEASGLCRSLDASGPPGQDAHVEILATPGLGGGMAKGRGTAAIYLDAFRVQRPVVADEGLADDAAVAVQPVHKEEALRYDDETGRGTRLIRLDDDQQEAPALSVSQARAVAAEGLRIEAALGGPQALELAFAGRLLHILQVTPIFLPTARIASTRLRSWDERLVPEGFRGVTTPLSFSVFVSTFLPAFVQGLERLGGPAKDLAERRAVLGRLLGLIGGRVVINVNALAAFLDLLPEGALLADGFARVLSVSALARTGDGNSLDDDTLKVGRLLKTSRRLATELDPTLTEIDAALHGLLTTDLENHDPDRLTDTLEHVLGLARRAETEHLICDGCAAAFFGVLHRMIARWFPEARPGLVNDLFAGDEPDDVKRGRQVVEHLVERVRRDPVLRAVFEQEHDGASLLDRLDGLPAADGLGRDLKTGLREVGARFVSERKLEAPGLAERPDVLLDVVLQGLAFEGGQEERLVLAEGVQKKAEYALFDQLPDRRMGLGRTSRKKLLGRVLFETREALARRRRIRDVQLEVQAALRRLVLVLGQRLFEHGVLAQPSDVFTLTLDELRGIVRGTAVDPDPQPLIAARKRAALRQPASLPEAFETVGVLATADLGALAEHAEEGPPLFIEGRPASSGEVAGEVRRLVLREDAGGLEVLTGFSAPKAGGVIVVRRPDPGLTLLLQYADAVVAERGDLLSPGVEALRALGVPTVIGARGALTWLKDGDVVKVNGRTGRVERVTASEAESEATMVQAMPSHPATDLVSHALSGTRTGLSTLEGKSAEHDLETHLWDDDEG